MLLQWVSLTWCQCSYSALKKITGMRLWELNSKFYVGGVLIFFQVCFILHVQFGGQLLLKGLCGSLLNVESNVRRYRKWWAVSLSDFDLLNLKLFLLTLGKLNFFGFTFHLIFSLFLLCAYLSQTTKCYFTTCRRHITASSICCATYYSVWTILLHTSHVYKSKGGLFERAGLFVSLFLNETSLDCFYTTFSTFLFSNFLVQVIMHFTLNLFVLVLLIT